MTHLSSDLRRVLERVVREARVVSDRAAREALARLGVEAARAPAYLSGEQGHLRLELRAHARALGDKRNPETEEQSIEHLAEAVAYGHWHRLLFARFLAERGLLRHPEHDVALSLADCRELAKEEGAPDEWGLIERYATAMLPGVFRADDPALVVELAPEHTQALRALVIGLDPAIFEASDSLGWTYQYWRAAEKDAVNKRGEKIGADELPAVTQLFTEPYMVHFLLHNTLGAWWASKKLAEHPELVTGAADEAELRTAVALPGVEWTYLRFVKDDERWRPAAGSFSGWPAEAAKITVMDPCCGSGHFLTEALPILAALRQAEERLSVADAVVAVLRDNLFGLELDGRCVQLGAFATALTAWRIGGWQVLPNPHIAWVGAPPPLPKPEFVALAEGDTGLRKALAALYDLFAEAPLLGSLIEVRGGDLADPRRLTDIEAAIERLSERLADAEPDKAEGAIAARGMADAAHLLGQHYTLQATNVPYLGRGKQNERLAEYIQRRFEEGKADLATAMLQRMLRMSKEGGSVAAVTPQNWLFLSSYKKLRERLLREVTLNAVAAIGEHGFQSTQAAGAFVALILLSDAHASVGSTFFGLDAHAVKDPTGKATCLSQDTGLVIQQEHQAAGPDGRINLKKVATGFPLSRIAKSYLGLGTGDLNRYTRSFWEVEWPSPFWTGLQGTVLGSRDWGGCEKVVYWDLGQERVRSMSQAEREQIHNQDQSGQQAWRRRGVATGLMRSLKTSLYTGEKFEKSVAVLTPDSDEHLPAIWCYCSSGQFHNDVRDIDRNIIVANATLVKVPFDLDHWQKVAAEKYPNGLPEPYSDDPTQWLFHGHPAQAEKGTALHVALARLAGYRWPAELDPDMRLSSEARAWIAKAAALPGADNDGLLAIPTVAGERPLVERLRSMLAAAFGSAWDDALERRLIAEADDRFDKKTVRDPSLEGWLRDRAFRQHCKLFHDRPFLWQAWDGTHDGFSAFLHYHRLDKATLEKLTYTLLNNWISRAKAEDKGYLSEAATLLQRKLELILAGEAPYDIFVRWKSLEQLPIGWQPDLDDGVRMNIRPFVTAGILRDQPNIKWAKDRGTDVKTAPWYPVHNGERINDHHTSLDEKQNARQTAETKISPIAGDSASEELSAN